MTGSGKTMRFNSIGLFSSQIVSEVIVSFSPTRRNFSGKNLFHFFAIVCMHSKIRRCVLCCECADCKHNFQPSNFPNKLEENNLSDEWIGRNFKSKAANGSESSHDNHRFISVRINSWNRWNISRGRQVIKPLPSSTN